MEHITEYQNTYNQDSSIRIAIWKLISMRNEIEDKTKPEACWLKQAVYEILTGWLMFNDLGFSPRGGVVFDDNGVRFCDSGQYFTLA